MHRTDFIIDNGAFLKGEESVREPSWYVKNVVIRGGKFDSGCLPVGAGAFSKIEHNIQNRSLNAGDDLFVTKGRALEMHAAYDSPM